MSIKSFIKSNPKLARIAFDILNARTARQQYRDNKDILERNKEFRDIYKGKRCFIIGTGPSLTISDLELLSDEITFAPNRIFELLSKTKWRPTYYVNQDHKLIQTYGEKIAAVECKNIFLPVEYVDKFKGDKFRFFVLKHKEFYPGHPQFSVEPSKQIVQGFTTIYGAIQLAAYMGFSEIFLIGVDHNYNIMRDGQGRPVKLSDSSTNYAKGMKEEIDFNNLPRVEETTLAFEFADKYSREHGFRIYNATRGGKLEAFERVNLDEILEGKK